MRLLPPHFCAARGEHLLKHVQVDLCLASVEWLHRIRFNPVKAVFVELWERGGQCPWEG